MTRQPSSLRRSEQRLNLRARVIVAFALAAIFILSINIFLAALLSHDINSNLDRTIQGVALSVLDGSSGQTSAAIAKQVGVLSLNDVISITMTNNSKDSLTQGPPDGLTALREVTSLPRNQLFSAGGWEFYRISTGKTTVVVGSSLSSIAETLQTIDIEIVILSITSLAIIAILSIWTISIAISPLASITAIARSIAAGARGTRVGLEPYLESTEVGDVAHAFNEVLIEKEGHIAREETLNAELQRLNQELRQFVADAGHELRTPLTSIQGYAQLLEGGARTPEAAASASARIAQEAARMSRLIDDLLKLARMESRVGMRYEYVDIIGLVKDQVADHMTVDPTRTVTVTGSPEIMADIDYDQFSGLIANLLANLRNHTPAGTSAAIDVQEDASNVKITYQDDGPGLDDPNSLFKRFWRSPGTRSPGTGLGMAIVYGTVRAHRGQIRAISASGQGLRLEIEIPLVAPEEGLGDNRSDVDA
jgi:two-component system, OmpR family, sensor kinase